MKDNCSAKKGTRLIDIPDMPIEQAIELLLAMPECLGEAVAKLCYSRITEHH